MKTVTLRFTILEQKLLDTPGLPHLTELAAFQHPESSWTDLTLKVAIFLYQAKKKKEKKKEKEKNCAAFPAG